MGMGASHGGRGWKKVKCQNDVLAEPELRRRDHGGKAGDREWK